MINGFIPVICFVSALLAVFIKAEAQTPVSDTEADTVLSTDIGWIAYPFAFYSPETKLAFGAGGIIHFRTAKIKALKPSKILFSGYYTTNSQYYVKLVPVIYLANENETIIEANLNYGKEIAKFYSVGNKTPDIENPEYSMTSFQIYLEVQSQTFFSDDIHSGPMLDFSTNAVFDNSSNPYLTMDGVTGSDGGNVSGLGWGWSVDRRNNIFFPTTNGYYKLKLLFYGRILGSEFTYNWFVLDLRHYFPIVEEGALAIQFYSEVTSGSPPFFRLPALGGSTRMRGYFYGRYRDQNYLTVQMEYRQIVWWRLGFAAFLGVGEVGPEFRNFSLNGLWPSYGLGLRFVFDEQEKINIRVDAGFGTNTSGIYFSLEEAF
jgi:hypothetical protein